MKITKRGRVGWILLALLTAGFFHTAILAMAEKPAGEQVADAGNTSGEKDSPPEVASENIFDSLPAAPVETSKSATGGKEAYLANKAPESGTESSTPAASNDSAASSTSGKEVTPNSAATSSTPEKETSADGGAASVPAETPATPSTPAGTPDSTPSSPSGETVDPVIGEAGTEPQDLNQLKANFLLLAALPEAEQAAVDQELSRLILLGDPDGSLRVYLEAQIKRYQLNADLEAVQKSIDGIGSTEEFANIGAVLQGMAVMGTPAEMIEEIRTVNETAAALLETIEFSASPELLSAVSNASVNLKSPSTRDQNVANILLYEAMIKSGLLTEAGVQTAKDGIREALSLLQGSPWQSITLDEKSEALAKRYQNAEVLKANSLISGSVAGFHPVNPLFRYGGSVMMSMEDAALLSGGTMMETGSNSAVALYGDGYLLEAAMGEISAYLNDRLIKMDQPVLYLDGVCYLPLTAVALCTGDQILENDGSILIYKPFKPVETVGAAK